MLSQVLQDAESEYTKGSRTVNSMLIQWKIHFQLGSSTG